MLEKLSSSFSNLAGSYCGHNSAFSFIHSSSVRTFVTYVVCTQWYDSELYVGYCIISLLTWPLKFGYSWPHICIVVSYSSVSFAHMFQLETVIFCTPRCLCRADAQTWRSHIHIQHQHRLPDIEKLWSWFKWNINDSHHQRQISLARDL